MKNIREIYLKIFSFLGVKFSIYLNRHVFVMDKNLPLYQVTIFFFLRENICCWYSSEASDVPNICFHGNIRKVSLFLVIKNAYTGGINMTLNEICSDILVSYTLFDSKFDCLIIKFCLTCYFLPLV